MSMSPSQRVGCLLGNRVLMSEPVGNAVMMTTPLPNLNSDLGELPDWVRQSLVLVSVGRAEALALGWLLACLSPTPIRSRGAVASAIR